MDETVAVRDVMDRSYVGVNEGDSVAGAAGLMDEEDVDSAVVLRGTEPVGLLRAEDVLSLVADGADPETTSVETAMVDSIETIDSDAPLADAVDAITGNGLRRVAVVDSGSVAGVIADHDIVSAQVIRSSSREPDEATVTAGASLGSDVYGSQGVCEVCGSLTGDLTDQNGQLVCADCVTV